MKSRKALLFELARYYRSPYWQRVRGRLLYERGGKCELCGSTAALQAHHLHYRYLYTEMGHMECLQLLCRACHATVGAGKRKASARSPLRDMLGRFLGR